MLILAEEDYSGGRIHTQTYTDTEWLTCYMTDLTPALKKIVQVGEREREREREVY
jgi:hypothetical protein